MKSKGHTIEGPKKWVRQTDEGRMAQYHREKTKSDHVAIYRYGK